MTILTVEGVLLARYTNPRDLEERTASLPCRTKYPSPAKLLFGLDNNLMNGASPFCSSGLRCAMNSCCRASRWPFFKAEMSSRKYSAISSRLAQPTP